MKKGNKSVKDLFYRYIVTLVVICLVISLIYMCWATKTNEQHLIETGNQMIENYATEMERMLETQKKISENLTINNIQFRTLSLSRSTENERLFAEYSLSELLRNQTPHYGISLLYHGETIRTLFFYGDDVVDDEAFLENASFMHWLGEWVSSEEGYIFNQWFLFQKENQWLLMLVNHYGTMYFCSIVDLNCYFRLYPVTDFENNSTALLYSDAQILIKSCDIDCTSIAGQIRNREGTFDTAFYKIISKKIDSCSIGVAVVVSWFDIVLEQVPYLTIFIFVVVVLGVFLWEVFHEMDRALTFPLREISQQMAQLSGQNMEPVLSNPMEEYSEFEAIRKALNELLDKKNEIEAQNYANMRQKEHAMLQYYQLQTRTHFFINCLKSLYGMTENYDRSRMQAMIISFSSHLRYIFHDTLKEVALKDELQEVNDYYHIIMLDMSRPFLLKQEVSQELFGKKVPPLAIQTFLENTYKYAGNEANILMFRIEITLVNHEGRNYLRIHLSDNGPGYPQEVLDSINSISNAHSFSKDHVGISNLIHRMQLLYGDDFQVAFYNEGERNAHSLLYIPVL